MPKTIETSDEDMSIAGSSSSIHITMDDMADPESLANGSDAKRKSDGTSHSTPALAVGDTRAVVCLRIVAALLLLGVAVGVSMSIYLYIHDAETEDFHQQFQDNALKLVNSFRHPHQYWPLFALPHFERRASFTLEQAQVISLMVLPLVTNETRFQWETFAQYKQRWLQESLAYQQEERSHWQNSEQDETALETVAQIGDGIQNQANNPHIWRLNGLTAGEENGDGPYLPIWQHAPAIPVADALNLNLLSHPAFLLECRQVLKEQQPLVGRTLDFSDETNPLVVGRKAILNLYLDRWKGGGNHYEDGPVSDLYIPIYDDFEDSNRSLVAMMVANVYWQVYFKTFLRKTLGAWWPC